MAEVRADVEAEERRAKVERSAASAPTAGGGFSATGSADCTSAALTWKPIAGLALVILVIAGGIGYAVGTGGSWQRQHPHLGTEGRRERRDRGDGGPRR